MKFQFIQTNDLLLTTHAGLTSVGSLLAHTNLTQRLNQTKVGDVKVPLHSHGDVMKSYLGLLCQGKSDFDAIEPFRKDEFFRLALDIGRTPSSPTLRQRLDQAAEKPSSSEQVEWKYILLEESADLIRNIKAPVTGIEVDEHIYAPLDIDVSPFDNSGTKKEGVSRTYKGTDGYAPIFAYLGCEGYGVHVELREGSVHCQNNTANFISQSITYAKRITSMPLLLRLDAGNDSLENIQICHRPDTQANYIIKRNLRRESKDIWLQIAKSKGVAKTPREGKTEYFGVNEFSEKGFETKLRQVFHVIERTSAPDGQMFLIPEIEVDVYWTSLQCKAERVIELYHDHGTSEQFHSEIKTDLDLERLPAGKFATNNLVLHAGLFAYNLLRIMGQESLQAPDAPLRNNVQRRRIRTVIQNMIYMAARVVSHARSMYLNFGKHSPWFTTVNRVYSAFT